MYGWAVPIENLQNLLSSRTVLRINPMHDLSKNVRHGFNWSFLARKGKSTKLRYLACYFPSYRIFRQLEISNRIKKVCLRSVFV